MAIVCYCPIEVGGHGQFEMSGVHVHVRNLDIKRTDGHTPSIGVSVSDVRSSYFLFFFPWLLEQSSAN
jgi:hypothetical protein